MADKAISNGASNPKGLLPQLQYKLVKQEECKPGQDQKKTAPGGPSARCPPGQIIARLTPGVTVHTGFQVHHTVLIQTAGSLTPQELATISSISQTCKLMQVNSNLPPARGGAKFLT